MMDWQRIGCAAVLVVVGWCGMGIRAAGAAPLDRHGAQPPSEVVPGGTVSADEAPPLTPDELRRLLPDLQADALPPPLWLTFQAGLHVPYQVLGLGLGLDVYPTPWLRLSALYSFGISPIEGSAKVSHYAEGAVGVRLLSLGTTTKLDIATHAVAYAPPVELKAFVPSYHALFVEGGVVSGFFSPARCLANCSPEFSDRVDRENLLVDARQFLMPFAGLRYVYFYQVGSAHARFYKRNYLQVYAHLFRKPFNTPEHEIFDWNGRKLDRSPWGGRVGFDLPPSHSCIADLLLHTGCAQGGFAIGYNPVPGFVFFEAHISYVLN